MITSGMRKGAGILCIVYMAVQSFQWWVFSKAPLPESTGIKDFLFGAEPISIVRSWLMLLSMFALFFIFFVLCFDQPSKNKGWNFLAFCGFSVFCLLEVILRSIELFYTQIQLPGEYLAASTAQQEIILSYVIQFQKIQGALYFPLGFSQMLGSFILALVFPATPQRNYVIKAVLYFNGIRLLLRTITGYLGIELFPDPIYGTLYLPMVYLMFGLKAWWLLGQRKADQAIVS